MRAREINDTIRYTMWSVFRLREVLGERGVHLRAHRRADPVRARGGQVLPAGAVAGQQGHPHGAPALGHALGPGAHRRRAGGEAVQDHDGDVGTSGGGQSERPLGFGDVHSPGGGGGGGGGTEARERGEKHAHELRPRA